MRRLTFLVAILLLVPLGGTLADAQDPTKLAGIVHGHWRHSFIECTQSARFKMKGDFGLGKPYRGFVNFDEWPSSGSAPPPGYPCQNFQFPPVSFHGTNPVSGRSVSGTCTGSYSNGQPGQRFFEATMDCAGRVKDASGLGPLGHRTITVLADWEETPSCLPPFDCGEVLDEYGPILGIYFRE